MHDRVRHRGRPAAFETVEAEMRGQGVEGVAAVRQIGDQGTDAGMIERLEIDIEKVVTLALQMRQDVPAGLAGSPGEYHALACHLRFSMRRRSKGGDAAARQRRSFRRPVIPQPVEGHRNDDERADKGALPECPDPHSPRPSRITSISAEPIRAPKAVPIPPARLAPPITAAAITCSSMPDPRSAVTAPSQPVWIMPAMPAESADHVDGELGAPHWHAGHDGGMLLPLIANM